VWQLARTFCVGVPAPSVPVRQARIAFLLPVDALFSLKQAVPSMTALQASELGSHTGVVAARAQEAKIARTPSEIRTLAIETDSQELDFGKVLSTAWKWSIIRPLIR
jgi:hypothetical protein